MKKLVYYSAKWCMPCNHFGPLLEQTAQQNNIPIEKIDVDSNELMTLKYHIKSIPTVILLDNEQEIKRFIGTKSANEILSFWNN